jgi:lactoylglutathione lyase
VLYPKAIKPDWAQHKPSIVFRCQDIDGVCAGLKARGVHFAKALDSMPWGTFASFRDLDGNEFGLSDG